MFTIRAKARAISNDSKYPLSFRFRCRMISMGMTKPTNEDKAIIIATAREIVEAKEYLYYANGSTL